MVRLTKTIFSDIREGEQPYHSSSKSYLTSYALDAFSLIASPSIVWGPCLAKASSMTDPSLPAEPTYATEIATKPSGEVKADPLRETNPAAAPIGDEPSDLTSAATLGDGDEPDGDGPLIGGTITSVRAFIEEKPLLSIAIAGALGLSAFGLFRSLCLSPRIRQNHR